MDSLWLCWQMRRKHRSGLDEITNKGRLNICWRRKRFCMTPIPTPIFLIIAEQFRTARGALMAHWQGEWPEDMLDNLYLEKFHRKISGLFSREHFGSDYCQIIRRPLRDMRPRYE
jgi:hypothetical protein